MTARVTVEAIPIVWIRITGEKRDDCLVSRFQQWCSENKVYPAVNSGMGGPGMHHFGYHAGDAEKALDWLKENGATFVPWEHPE